MSSASLSPSTPEWRPSVNSLLKSVKEELSTNSHVICACDSSPQDQLPPSLWPAVQNSTSVHTPFSVSQRAGGVTASRTVPTSQMKSCVPLLYLVLFLLRLTVLLDISSVWMIAACPPYCAVTAFLTVLMQRMRTAAVSMYLYVSCSSMFFWPVYHSRRFHAIHQWMWEVGDDGCKKLIYFLARTVKDNHHLHPLQYFMTSLLSASPCLRQLYCSVNWENWCVKVGLLVSHVTSVVTTLPTVCLFTLMSPAAMVTCFHVPSLFKLFIIKRTLFYAFLTLKVEHIWKG